MKTCPKCGRALLDKAIMCAYCGASLPVAAPQENKFESLEAPDLPDPPETINGPEIADTSIIPEDNAERSHSHKTMIAIVCAVVLVCAGVLVFFLMRGETFDEIPKSITIANWMEINGRETERTASRLDFDERGLIRKVSLLSTETNSGEIPKAATFEYQFDDHDNPKTLTIQTNDANDPETLTFSFANQYDGKKLVQVDITSDQAEAVASLFQYFTGFMGYREALITAEGIEAQIQDGKCVHHKQMVDEAIVSEITNEFKDDKLVWTIQRNMRDDEEIFYCVIEYDDSGRITKQTFRNNGVTRTYAFSYEESTDTGGRACLVPKLDPDQSRNLSNQDIENYTGDIRYYLNEYGDIAEIVSGDALHSSSTKYDRLRRVISQSSRECYSDAYVSCTETTYEYR